MGGQSFQPLIEQAFAREWVVYAKRPFGGPEQVLRYLARYTHRTAISNHRMVAVTDEDVTFRWKDYADGHQHKNMTLPATEFLSRFLQHVLPKGFVRIRFFGLLAHRHRAASLAICRALLAAPVPAAASPDPPAKPLQCPACHTGWLRTISRLPNLLPPRLSPPRVDSS